jgi:ABC-type phosphate/phosphonate transport system substrate-binding protein
MTPGKRARLTSALVVGALALTGSPDARAADEPSPGKLNLVIGFSAQVFEGVDNEAWSVAKVWANQIMKRRLGEGSIRTVVYRDDVGLEAAIRRGELDVTGIIADEFVTIRNRVHMQPAFLTASAAGVKQSVVLLVRRDAGIQRLPELKNKRLSISVELNKSIHLKWLDILLMREGFRTAPAYFSRVSTGKGPNQAILSVFFGQSDACLTTMQAFRVASELNPQVGKELLPLIESPGTAVGLIAFRPDLPASDRKRISEVLETLHEDPEGR